MIFLIEIRLYYNYYNHRKKQEYIDAYCISQIIRIIKLVIQN